MAGIFCTIAAEKTLSSSGDDRYANGMLAGVLLIGKLRNLWTYTYNNLLPFFTGTLMTAMIKADYRRQAASNK